MDGSASRAIARLPVVDEGAGPQSAYRRTITLRDDTQTLAAAAEGGSRARTVVDAIVTRPQLALTIGIAIGAAFAAVAAAIDVMVGVEAICVALANGVAVDAARDLIDRAGAPDRRGQRQRQGA